MRVFGGDKIISRAFPKLSALSLMVGVSLSVAPLTAHSQACECIATNIEGAGEISGLVAQGALSVTQAITEGFTATGSTVEQAVGQQTKDLTNILTAITKTLVSEIDQIPVEAQKYEANLDSLSPARHATDGCTYNNRTKDSVASEHLANLQEDNLNTASTQYNKMTSSYPVGVDPTDRFYVQTGEMLRKTPGVATSGAGWVSKSSSFGALTPEELQNTSTFINITTNPNPAEVSAEVSSSNGLKRNVDADLYNMRMSIPQAVQNQILSYRAPVVAEGGGIDGEKSWLIKQLSHLSPGAAKAVKEGDIDVSKEDLLKLMATHRVQDRAWVANISAKHPSGVMKDLALLKADSLKMDYELWLQDKNTSLLLSQMLSAQIRAKRGN